MRWISLPTSLSMMEGIVAATNMYCRFQYGPKAAGSSAFQPPGTR